jgi:membrane-associated phospholipid phosphatase
LRELLNNYVKNYWGFGLPYVLFLLTGVVFLLFFEKGDMVLFFNNNQNDFLNVLFKLATKLAEISVLTLVFLALLWFSYGNLFLLLIGFLVNSIVVQFLKKIVFNMPRPALYFKDAEVLNFLPGLAVNFHHSFPSGHTSSAFLVFSMLALFTEKKWLQFICFLLAVLAGLSRVYLLQHFFMDVIFGAVLGVTVSYATFYLIHRTGLFSFHKWKHLSLSQYLRK